MPSANTVISCKLAIYYTPLRKRTATLFYLYFRLIVLSEYLQKVFKSSSVKSFIYFLVQVLIRNVLNLEVIQDLGKKHTIPHTLNLMDALPTGKLSGK